MAIDLIGRFFFVSGNDSIGHFLVRKTLTLKTRPMQKLSCDSFALSLALKQRLGARNWPIGRVLFFVFWGLLVRVY